MDEKIPLKENFIYGPVKSRRLGKSLGVNLSPLGKKVCSFDCVYCQYGVTKRKSRIYEKGEVPTPAEVGNSLAKALEEMGEDPDYITFSGNGEPTLHPEFGKVLGKVSRVRNRLSGAQIVLLSNSSTVNDAEMLAAISEVDLPIMKLDVGTSGKFEQINRPLRISLAEVLEGLREIDDLHLQSIKFDGEISNAGSDVLKWAEMIGEPQPQQVQIYSLDRPCSLNLEKIGRDRLQKIQKILAKKGVASEIFQ